MILQTEENKGVELTVYVCKGLVAMECGRGGVSGEKSTPAHLSPKSVAPGQGKELLQLSVFGLGGDEDGDVGVGVFPESEEILIGGAGFGCITLEHVSPGEGEL